MRFILILLLVAGAGLVLTNPAEEVVRAKIDGALLAQLGGGAGTQNPAGGAVTSMLGDKVQGQIALTRTNYYVLSLYKVSVGGKALPGCLIGIAGQAIPYDKC